MAIVNKAIIAFAAMGAAAWTGIASISPTVAAVTAQQRYLLNGKVDITCSVSGIGSATTELKFAVAAVMPDSGEVHEVSHFWVVRNGTNSTDLVAHTNGDYRLVWDAQADLGAGRYTNMVVRVALAVVRPKVQLWENGPYWATTNIGAESPWESGYYFWWGDTVGYKHENDAWVASDGSSSNFSFDENNMPICNKSTTTLQSEGWITFDNVLAPEHDAAQVQWGTNWRMPTYEDFIDLNYYCDSTWTTTNGVNGYIVRGKGDYASASIFFPASGYGHETFLSLVGSHGSYWSSVPESHSVNEVGSIRYLSYSLGFIRDNLNFAVFFDDRYYGLPVRPVQGFTTGGPTGDLLVLAGYTAPFLLDLAYTAFTRTTQVPVSYAWLRRHTPGMADEYNAYEAAAKATAANGRKVWECFAMGFDPTDPLDDFRITAFWMDGDVPMFEFSHTEDGDGNSFLHLIKPLGKANLEDAWQHVPEGGDPSFRFFAAEVVLPGSGSIVDAYHAKVQLWENGPYWATTNIGAENPWDSGYYFWWGDTVGYKRENDAWVASDGSSSNFSFDSANTSTCEQYPSDLQNEGWITSDNVLAPEHDAAHVQWGGDWRMPTYQELADLCYYKCDWTWTTTNGVNGYIVRGRGDYASVSIFLPASGYGYGTSLYSVGSYGDYWSSVPFSRSFNSWGFCFNSDFYCTDEDYRDCGQVVRPVQGFTK